MSDLAQVLAWIALSAPLLTLLILTAGLLAVGRRLPELRVQQLTAITFGIGLLASLAMAVLLALSTTSSVVVDLGSMLSLRAYHFDLALELTGTTLVLLVLNFLLCGLVGAFSARYLHQDPGFFRFYLLLVLFALGMELIATARGLDLLFVGWEFVGLTSALLIAYFHQRAWPVHNGLRAYATYRITDVGLLAAVILLEHSSHTAAFSDLSTLSLAPGLRALIGGLIVFGAMGKGAMVPFTGWLPRAMEGPTPSSAIFYGALSVHASPFLLLRAAPLFESNVSVRAAIAAIGAVTALHASMVGRVQSDIKTALGYASVAQIGLLWIEVAMGWYTLALVHMAGHAVMRTWQLLRSPSLLHERHQRMALRGRHPSPTGRGLERLLPDAVQRFLYGIALERWYLEAISWNLIQRPARQLLLFIEGFDARLRHLLGAHDQDALEPGQAREASQDKARATTSSSSTSVTAGEPARPRRAAGSRS